MSVPKIRWAALIMVFVWGLRFLNVPAEWQTEIAAAALVIVKLLTELANQITAEEPEEMIYKRDRTALLPFWQRVL